MDPVVPRGFLLYQTKSACYKNSSFQITQEESPVAPETFINDYKKNLPNNKIEGYTGILTKLEFKSFKLSIVHSWTAGILLVLEIYGRYIL